MTVNWNTDATIDNVRAAAFRGVANGVEAIRANAIRRIQSGDKSGVIYRRGGVEHQASAPGEAPASDTGTLVQRTRTELNPQAVSGQVIFATAYAAALEFGTEKMAARPYARPALAEEREKIVQGVTVEIQTAVTTT